MAYQYLKTGDRLREGDEYSTSYGVWKSIPSFMVGDIITKSTTQWRRFTEENIKEETQTSKTWLDFLKFWK